jgi:hypothetical protein
VEVIIEVGEIWRDCRSWFCEGFIQAVENIALINQLLVDDANLFDEPGYFGLM